MADRGQHRGHRGGGRGDSRGASRGGRGGGEGRGGRGGAAASGERPKKENILDLGKYMDKRIVVKFTGGREGAFCPFSPAFVLANVELRRVVGRCGEVWMWMCANI